MKTKFTVERATWFRGQGPDSRLFVDGKRCCLGFVGKQCGIPDEEMANIGRPNFVTRQYKLLYPAAFLKDEAETRFTDKCVLVNDNMYLDDVDREKTLVMLFEEQGLELEFV